MSNTFHEPLRVTLPLEIEERAAPIASRSRIAAPAGLLSLLGCLLIYLLRLDRIVGLAVDDAWYVLLAKSLATGQGYTLLNSPTPGILPLYPPAFPWLLSLLYRLAPGFPENVYLFKAVSIAAMLVAGVLIYRYFERERALPWFVALSLAVASVLTPMLVLLATSTVMSECFFTLLFIAIVVLIERSARAGRSAQGLRLAAAAGAVTAIAFLTRSIGVALIVAGFLYLLKKRLLPAALAFATVAVLLAAPWVVYTRLHAPTPEQQREQGGHIVLPYTQQFWQRLAGDERLGNITAAELPARVAGNIAEIAGRDVLRIVAAPVFEALRDPFVEVQQEHVRRGESGQPLLASFVLSLLLLAGFVAVARQGIPMGELAVLFSLGITVLWPWETIRFVLPLTPFLLFYLLSGARLLFGLAQRRTANGQAQWKAMAVAASLVIAINLYGNLHYIVKAQSASPLERPQWLRIFAELETMFAWTSRSVPQDALIASSNAPLLHLYTGHKTVTPDNPAANWENWNRLGVRYLMRNSAYPEPVEPAEASYKTIYRSQSELGFRVLDLGDPRYRPAWNNAR
jgi:hypothetical protein